MHLSRYSVSLALCAVATGFLISSCATDGAPTAASLSFDVDTVWAPPGRAVIVSAFAKDASGNPVPNARVTWKVLDTAIATVASTVTSDSQPTATRATLKGLRLGLTTQLAATLPNGVTATTAVRAADATVIYDVRTVLSSLTYETGYEPNDPDCMMFSPYCYHTIPTPDAKLVGTVRIPFDSATATFEGCMPPSGHGGYGVEPLGGNNGNSICGAAGWHATLSWYKGIKPAVGEDWSMSFLYNNYGPSIQLIGRASGDSIVGSVYATHSVWERGPSTYTGTFVARRRQ